MEPSPSARRFDARLRLYVSLGRIIAGTDGSDVLTVVSLGLVFAGLSLPSLGCAVVGGLLVLITPIGGAFRLLVRGR